MITEKSRTAAAYVRVSDERQDEFSPDSQLKLIKDYCNRNNIILPDELIFYDDGISAKSVKRRKQFNDMIALAKQKEKPFNTILVWKFSRFARNQEESIVYKSLLRKNGVEVISVSEPIQDNPFGGLIERIIEWMDEYYLIRLSDEVRRGMTERATRGMPNTAPPFGYVMKEGKYVIQENEAETVRKIFEMFNGGYKILKIADSLRMLGIVNRNGNYIDTRMVEYILYNPTYTGYVRWNPKGRSASARIFNNPDDILRKSDHESIVDDETFNKAQELLKIRRQNAPKYSHENPIKNEYMLRSLVKCGNCGATLVYIKASNSLQCHRYVKGTCGMSHSITMPKINGMVIDALRDASKNLTFNIESPEESPTNISIDYDKLISTEKLKLERARQAYQEGVDSLNEYKATKQTVEAKIKNYTNLKQKELLKAKSLNTTELADSIVTLVSFLSDPDVEEAAKNQALKAVVQKAVYFKQEGRIELYFNG